MSAVLAVCPVCRTPIARHDEATARWCYKAWLARDPRGLARPERETLLEEGVYAE